MTVLDACHSVPVSGTQQQQFTKAALRLSRSAAAVANFCDHTEHNEFADVNWVIDAAADMRGLACQIASESQTDLKKSYAKRLRIVEMRSPHWTSDGLDGGALVEASSTWRELQVAQNQHDRFYHPDVAGLAKAEQLRHYALHVAKLAGAVAEVAEGISDYPAFSEGRLPDLLLFGVKLPTVMGQRLPETVLALPSSRILASA